MAVHVRLFAAARAAVGSGTADLAAGSIGQLMEILTQQFPDFARVAPQCSFLVDSVATTNRTQYVDDGQTLDVLPPFAGG